MATISGGSNPTFTVDQVLHAVEMNQLSQEWIVDSVPAGSAGKNGDVVFVTNKGGVWAKVSGSWVQASLTSADTQTLQDQIDTIQSSGYDDTQLRADFAAADASTLADSKTYTDNAVSGISVDTSNLATKAELDAEEDARKAADALLQTQIDAIDEYDESVLKGRVNANEANITALKGEQVIQDVAIKDNKDAIDALVIPDVSDLATKTELDTKFDKGATTYADAKAMEDAIAQNVTNIEAISASGGYNDAWIQTAIDAEEEDRIDGDAALQGQIDIIQSSGYDDTQLRTDFAAADTSTLSSANAYTDSKVYDDTALEASVAQNTSDISDLQTEQGTQDSLIQANTDAIALLDDYDDTALRGLIAVEEAARISGDADLASDISKNTADIAAINANGAYDDTALRGLISDEEAARIAGDATTLSSANTYTDAEVAKIVVPNVDDFATTDYVVAGDATTLSSSKTYTDEEIAKIPATDVSDLATKTELTTGLAGKADEPHTHDTSHDHDSEYQPVGDYATNAGLTSGLATKSDTGHDHSTYASTDHVHVQTGSGLTFDPSREGQVVQSTNGTDWTAGMSLKVVTSVPDDTEGQIGDVVFVVGS